MQGLIRDLKFTLRQVRRNLGFAIATVLTLGLGIGANTAIFTMIDGLLLRPLPYAHGERLVHVRYGVPALGADTIRFSVPEVFDLRSQNHSFEGLSEFHSMSFTLLGRGEPERIETGVVSANAFEVLGVKPLLGRSFVPEDEQPGAPPVVLLSHGFWHRRFGGDPGIVGQNLQLNGRSMNVIGVLPPLPAYPGAEDIYISTSACPVRSSQRTIENRSLRILTLYARLKPGVQAAQASSDLSTIASRLRRSYPESYPQNIQRVETSLVPVAEDLVGGFRPTLLIVLGTVGLVLLIACINVGNLSLSRMIDREGEIAVRAALGASRRSLIRQMLTESTVLSLAGGVLGVLLAALGLRLLVAFAGRFTPLAQRIELDGRTLLFTLVIALASGLAFGLLPAFHVARHDLATALREGEVRASAGGSRHRLRNSLLVVQVATSFGLLMLSGLTVRSAIKLQQVSLGFNPRNVLSLALDLPFSRYAGPQQELAFYRALLQRVEALPGVVSVGVASSIPLASHDLELTTPSFKVEGRGAAPGEPEQRADSRTASPDYFRTLGIPLIRGRIFTNGDESNTQPVVLINKSMARHYWPGEEPIGKRIALTVDPAKWFTIVGVVGDVRHNSISADASDAFYRSFLQRGGIHMRLFVRTAGDPAGVGRSLPQAIHDIDPQQPIAETKTLEEVRDASTAPSRLTATLLTLFAALAFGVTVTGISGTVACSVNERTPEIGIRTALGAGHGQVMGLVVRETAVLVVMGLCLGAAVALTMTRLISSVLFDVRSNDPVTFAAAAVALLLVVGITLWRSAHRAAKIDPIAALRAER
jgi:putative ABC transport system permease protein